MTSQPTDDQLARQLMNLATDAHLSGNAMAHRTLSLAAVRLLELTRHWHPSMQVSNGVTATDWETGR